MIILINYYNYLTNYLAVHNFPPFVYEGVEVRQPP